MRILNFLDAPSAPANSALRSWKIVTMTTSMLMIIILCLLQGFQWYDLFALRQEQKKYSLFPAGNKNKLLHKKMSAHKSNNVQTKNDLITSIEREQKNLLIMLHAIKKALPASMDIISCTFTKNNFILTTSASDLRVPLQCISALQKNNELFQINLVSLKRPQESLPTIHTTLAAITI